MDVNETSDHGDLNSPFYQPEGAIVEAASSGHLEVVRWMLDHRGQINYTVQDKPRCLPLIRASTNGHLEIVKLLVEYGADIHACWQGLNAVTQAERFGRDTVRDYLRSLGAKDLRESTPPDYATAHELLIAETTSVLGPLGNWHQLVPGEPSVIIHVIPANEDCEWHTLFTVGLSDHRLPRKNKEFAAAELRIALASDWPLDEGALTESEWNWPVTLVEQLRTADKWPDEMTSMNGDPPAPLAAATSMCGWIYLRSDSLDAPDYRTIDIYNLFPIYAEEQLFVREHGWKELMKRFEEHGVPKYMDPGRPNMVISK